MDAGLDVEPTATNGAVIPPGGMTAPLVAVAAPEVAAKPTVMDVAPGFSSESQQRPFGKVTPAARRRTARSLVPSASAIGAFCVPAVGGGV